MLKQCEFTRTRCTVRETLDICFYYLEGILEYWKESVVDLSRLTKQKSIKSHPCADYQY